MCFLSSELLSVTIRERDSMDQVRVPIAGLVEALRERLAEMV
jgi:glycyl-tRNA synthetase (class II)